MIAFFISIIFFLLSFVLSIVFVAYIYTTRNAEYQEEGAIDKKKYNRVNLHKYYGLLLSIGLLFSLSFSLFIIEYPTFELKIRESGIANLILDDEIIDIPITEMPPPPPPQKIKTPEIIEVPDEKIIEEPEVEIEPEVEPEPEDFIDDVIDEEAVPEEEVNTILNITEVSQQPTFPGGVEAFYKFIKTNYQMPPRDAAEGNKGKIFVQFVINKDGSVSDVKVVRGINDRMDAEAVRVVKNSPRWAPGRNAGAPVRVRYMMPVTVK